MPLGPWLEDFIRRSGLHSGFADEIERLHRPLAARIAQRVKAQGPGFVVGLCGPQGSGKSTLVQVLAGLLGEAGLSSRSCRSTTFTCPARRGRPWRGRSTLCSRRAGRPERTICL